VVTRSRIVALALLAGTTAGLIAACGSGGSGAGAAPSPSGPQAALAAYVDCLNKNGVTIALPSANADGRPNRSGFPTSRPSGLPTSRPSGFPQGSGRPTARPSGSGGFGRGFGGGFLQKPGDVDQATWDKAMAACSSVRPSFGPGRGGDNGANAAYQNCLRDHGATAGATPAADALKACEVLKPTAAPTS
jgi:hypothetical protein